MLHAGSEGMMSSGNTGHGMAVVATHKLVLGPPTPPLTRTRPWLSPARAWTHEALSTGNQGGGRPWKDSHQESPPQTPCMDGADKYKLRKGMG